LETFLDIYKNPKHWNIILRPKNDDLDSSMLLKNSVGKLIIKTYFDTNPFIVPIQCLTHTLQGEKTFKVIIADIEDEEVVSSAEFV
jgi:hypothetical protein